jgi:hypothetical protein
MNIFNKIAAVLALFLGLMSVLAGSMVLLGIDTKEYNILTWLVSYNVIFGVISIFAAYLIWRENKKSKYLNLFILAMHFMIFFILRFFSSNVASESIKAMVFRTSIWVLIILLSLIVPIFINKQQK